MIRYLAPVFLSALALPGCGVADAGGEQPPPGNAETRVVVDDPRLEPAVSLPQDVLATEIDRLALDFGGSVGIAVVDVESDWSTGFDADNILPQQSVSKLWVAITALDRVDRGDMRLSDTIRLTRNDLAVFHQPIRAQILREGAVTKTVEDLIERALIESDNTANDAVLNTVGGPDAVRSMLTDKELTSIRFGPGERLMQSAIAGLAWRQSYAFTRLGFFDARDLVPDEEREIAFNSYQSNPVDGATPQAIATALARLDARRTAIAKQHRLASVSAAPHEKRPQPAESRRARGMGDRAQDGHRAILGRQAIGIQ